MNQKIITETRKLLVITLFLFVFLGGFATYRKLILSEYKIDYFLYGYNLVEALVLAKVILIGDLLHLGERFSDRPLIIPTLYKTLSFSVLVLVFAVVEHLIGGFVHGKNAVEVFRELAGKGQAEILAKILVMFIAFIPMFAIWEVARVSGEGELFALFFEPRRAADPAVSERIKTAPLH